MKKILVILVVVLLLSACSGNILQSSKKYNVSEDEEYIIAWAEDLTFEKALYQCKENICLYCGYIDEDLDPDVKWLTVQTGVFKVEIVDRFEIRDTGRHCVSIKISKAKNEHLIKRE